MRYFPIRFPSVGPRRFAYPGSPLDFIAPAVNITSSENGFVTAAFAVTITFSEPVTGFVVGDITVGNGTAGNFATADNMVFTADITPTAAGTVTVAVAAGVCTDIAGNSNAASNTFSIVYGVFLAFVDLPDPAVKFQDAARTTIVTAADQEILGVADKSGNNNHFSTVTGNAFVNKLNVLGGQDGAYSDDNNNYLGFTPFLGTNPFTLIFSLKYVSGNYGLAGASGATNRIVISSTTTMVVTGATNITFPALTLTDPHIVIFQYDGTNVRVRFDNSATWYSQAKGTFNASTWDRFFQCRESAGVGFVGNPSVAMAISGAIADSLIDTYRDKINELASSVFF